MATDGATGAAVWGVGTATAVLLLGGTAFGVRQMTARRLEKALGRAAQDRDALRASSEAQLYGLAAERQALLQEREELFRQLNEAAGYQAQLAQERDSLAQDLDELARERDEATSERDEATRERDELLGSVDATFVNLAMRTLTLVERQLVLIEALEGREADATQLESLFRLDHLATRMRRNSENMLLLAGLENSQRSKKTVSLLDVVRAAVSEIERYERVKIGFLASVRLSGAVADDTSHLLAELLENATAFSPPQDQVEVGGWLLDNGEVMVSVIDRGIGLPAERMRLLNEQLSEPVESTPDRRDALLAGAMTGRSMGLFVVARMARRHGMRVQLRENAQGGGVTAMVVLPCEALLHDSVTTEDLDDQRRAERSVTSLAEQARAAARQDADPAAVAPQARPAQPVRPAASPAAEAGDGTPPALPRRKPVQSAEQQPADRADEHQRAQAESSPATRATEEPPAPAEPALAEAAVVPAAETVTEPAAPPAGPVTVRGLPRRVPSGNGLPGTGEAPVSGLRRVAVETEAAAVRPAPASGVTGSAGAERRTTSPEELRRRLGGFQSGLRQAAREPAQAEPAQAEPTAEPAAEGRPEATRGGQDR